jgi:hypothetical protein
VSQSHTAAAAPLAIVHLQKQRSRLEGFIPRPGHKNQRPKSKKPEPKPKKPKPEQPKSTLVSIIQKPNFTSGFGFSPG